MGKRRESEKEKAKKSSLLEQIETEVDSADNDVEMHIAPFIQSIKNLKMGEIDLTNAQSAKNAIPMLDELLEKINTYQKTAKVLKSVLEEKRDDFLKKSH